MSIPEKAIQWAVSIAEDNSHGYDQYHRWGPDYDCSSLIIQAYQNAGLPIKQSMAKLGAYYTGTMKRAFIENGFDDVKDQIQLSTGAGLIPGDVLLNEVHHTAMYIGYGKIVQASISETGSITGVSGDQTGKEIYIRSYYNPSYKWDCVLRYKGDDDMSYEQFLDYMDQYKKDAAAKGVPDDPKSWIRQSYTFVKDNDLSDGLRPYSYVTRAEVWGMLKNFYVFISKLILRGK